jgi:outer membrane biosynthesis protein TonB
MTDIIEDSRSKISTDVRGLGVSVIFHAIALAFLFFYTINFTIEKDPPLEEGIQVTLGFEDANSEGTDVQGEQMVEPTPIEATPTVNTPAASKPVENNEVSSKTSEAVVKTKTTPVKPTETKVQKTVPATNTNNQSTSNSTSASNSNNNNEKVNEQKKKFGTLFGGSGQGDGPGNAPKGSPEGDPNSGALEGISKGRGTIGGGLSGRKVTQAPTISENSQKYGKVVIKVCVDKTGKVISSKFTQAGSTTTDAQLVSIAEKGAKKYQFGPGELDSQCGTISFDFKLN